MTKRKKNEKIYDISWQSMITIDIMKKKINYFFSFNSFIYNKKYTILLK